uniref:Uncharacterized protein n=1 Tax=Magallana gigas TaxID=29159 RepID=A0A8W8NL39_MAGGI
MNYQVLFGIRDKQVNRSEEYPYSIEIQAAVIKPRLLENHLCSVLRENISKILENLTKTFPLHEEAYLEGYRCVRKPYNSLPDGNIILEKDMSKDVDCTKCVQGHVVEVQSILGFWKKAIKRYENLPIKINYQLRKRQIEAQERILLLLKKLEDARRLKEKLSEKSNQAAV